MRQLKFSLLSVLLIVSSCVSAAPQSADITRTNLMDSTGFIWHFGGPGNFYEVFAKNGLDVDSMQFFALSNSQEKSAEDAEQILTTDDLNKDQIARFRAGVLDAKKAGITPLASLYTVGNELAAILKRHEYRHVVMADGQVGFAPCPLERRYWFGIWLPVWKIAAQTLKEADVAGGVLLENESYPFGTIYPGYWDPRKRHCFCDHCFGGFLAKQGIKTDSLPEKSARAGWVDGHGLAVEYEKYLEDALAQIVAEATIEARKIWPHFFVAQYPYFAHWYCNGIIRGSSTSEQPSLLHSHIEYYNGYYTFSRSHQDYLRSRGFNARYFGGLTIGYYTPVQLAMNIIELMDHTDGYWLYWGGTLTDSNWKDRMPASKDFDKLSHEYRLLAPPSQYWRAIRLANRSRENASSKTQSKTEPIPVQASQLVARDNCTAEIKGRDFVITGSDVAKAKNLLPEHWLNAQAGSLWKNLLPGQVSSEGETGRKIVDFGPDNGQFDGNWYIERTVSVPKNSWLLLTAEIEVEGPDEFTYIGLGKLNWYDWQNVVADGKRKQITRLVKLGKTPSLLIEASRQPSQDIMVRFHISATENHVKLYSLTLEPVIVGKVELCRDKSVTAGQLSALSWDSEESDYWQYRAVVADGSGKELFKPRYEPGQDLGVLRTAFGLPENKLRFYIEAYLTAARPSLRLKNLAWQIER
ncbi:MAG: hypothetical protein ABIG61_08570 [Planctomycetota bacterium]